MESESNIGGLVNATANAPTATAPAQVGLPYDIRASADTMTQYLLTKDKIQVIRSGVATDESTMFGIAVGAAVAILTVLIPLYVSGDEAKTGRLIPFMWAMLFASVALSFYFGRKWYRLRKASDKTFNDILDNSKTILIFPKQQ
jgi:hypothetical protein